MISLDPEQSAAIFAKSPVIVNASAGSGKTRCLIARIELILGQGVSPRNICAVTFTNKAANEMKNRLKANYPISIKEMQISTIHSLCVKIIKKFTRHTFLLNPFSIYDESDQLSIIKTIVKSRDLPGQPYDYISAIGLAKAQQTEELLEEDFFEVYKTYKDILFKNAVVNAINYLMSSKACPFNFTYKIMEKKGWLTNGIVGQAWIIEALLSAHQILDDDKSL